MRHQNTVAASLGAVVNIISSKEQYFGWQYVFVLCFFYCEHCWL